MLRRARAAQRAAVLACAILAGCGGGGGGGGGDAGPGGAPVTISPSQLQASYLEDEAPESLDIQIRLVAQESVFIGVVDPTDSVMADSRLVFDGSGDVTRATLKIMLRDLTPGTHSGSLSIYLCADSACSSQRAGSPMTVPYELTVGAHEALTFTPTALSIVAAVGEPVTFDIDGIFRANTWGTLVSVEDSGGNFEPDHWLLTGDPVQSSAKLSTYPGPSFSQAGTYAGTLDVQVMGGNPTRLRHGRIPYMIRVISQTDARALPAASGPEWTQPKGNSNRSAYVPIAVDLGRVTKRWMKDLQNTALPDSPELLTADGKVLVLGGCPETSPGLRSPCSLQASNEGDGTPAWVHYAQQNQTIYPPTVVGSRVFFAESRLALADDQLYSLDAASGATVFSVSTGQSPSGRPAVSRGSLVLGSSFRSGVSSFDLTTGAQLNTTSLVDYASLAEIVAWNGLALTYGQPYSADEPKLSGFDLDSGSLAFSLSSAQTDGGGGSVLLSGADTVVGAGFDRDGRGGVTGRLVRYSLPARTLDWTISTPSAISAAAAAPGALYTVGMDGRVEARDEATGALRWQWNDAGSNSVCRDIVVTQSHLFVSCARATYAIDLATHATAWRYHRGGWMAVSARRVLYLLESTGRLHAFNLF